MIIAFHSTLSKNGAHISENVDSMAKTGSLDGGW